jgi:hypothetical protein
VEFYFNDSVYLRYHFLAVYEKANRYNVLQGIGVGEQLHVGRSLERWLAGTSRGKVDPDIYAGVQRELGP